MEIRYGKFLANIDESTFAVLYKKLAGSDSSAPTICDSASPYEQLDREAVQVLKHLYGTGPIARYDPRGHAIHLFRKIIESTMASNEGIRLIEFKRIIAHETCHSLAYESLSRQPFLLACINHLLHQYNSWTVKTLGLGGSKMRILLICLVIIPALLTKLLLEKITDKVGDKILREHTELFNKIVTITAV